MNRVVVTSEPIYDEDTLPSIKEMETHELIKAILEYLEAMVVELKQEVNDLTPPDKHKPYEDIHSDIYEMFEDYPAYQRFRMLFECE